MTDEEMERIPTRIMPLPNRIMGFVTGIDNGDYCIVLNANHSREANELAYWHEMKHIFNGDVWSDKSADQIEGEAK